MALPTEEELEESRTRLGIPSDWEWYSCAAECGDVTWVPPGVGDMPLRAVCSTECAIKMITG